MSFSLSISLLLGSSQTGLTLSAQLIDSNGDDYGTAITTGFTEVGNGNYLWFYNAFPDDFAGGVSFSAGGEVKTIVEINPSAEVDLTPVTSGISDLSDDISSLTDDVAAISPTGIANGVAEIEIESGVSLKQALSIIGSVLAGKLSGTSCENCPTTIVFKGMNNDTTRVEAVVDGKGNRNSITFNLPSWGLNV